MLNKKTETNIEHVFTTAEAATLWNLDNDTVRQACIDSQNGTRKNPFHPNEYRKSKTNWLVTMQGMTRLYGSFPTKI